MFKKIVLAAVAASTGVLFFAACGGNDCQTAADDITAKLKSCNITTTGSTGSTSSSSGSSSCTAEEGTAALAIAKCYTDATCATLQGTDMAGAQKLAECQLAAASAGGTTSSTSSTGTGG